MATALQDEVVHSITQRLSLLSDLRLPHSFTSREDPITQPEKKSHLVSLLQRDAAVFLERYGSSLSRKELQEFEVLKEDYEVNWHLKHLKSSMEPTAEEQKSHVAVVKNRRLAFMDRLIEDGQFFSEDAMRMRAPLLHHEYVGKFQDPSDRAFARPGERWSDTLIRQGEEMEYQARLRTEREKAEATMEEEEEEEEEEEVEAEERWSDMLIRQGEEMEYQVRLRTGREKTETVMEEEEEEETEEEEEEEEEEALDKSVSENEPTVSEHREREETGADSRSFELSTYEEQQQLKLDEFTHYMQVKFLAGENSGTSKPSISSEELQCKMDDFTRIMQEKFLSGEDSEHFDYASIDRDTALDDYWLKEVSQDAEDKYFDED